MSIVSIWVSIGESVGAIFRSHVHDDGGEKAKRTHIKAEWVLHVGMVPQLCTRSEDRLYSTVGCRSGQCLPLWCVCVCVSMCVSVPVCVSVWLCVCLNVRLWKEKTLSREKPHRKNKSAMSSGRKLWWRTKNVHGLDLDIDLQEMVRTLFANFPNKLC